MISKAVHHVSFSVRELAPALHFYRDVLGFQPIERPEMGLEGAWLQAGDSQVHLIVAPEGADVGTPPRKATPIANHTAFAIDDYERVRDHLRASGLDVLEPLGYRVDLRVLDHRVELGGLGLGALDRDLDDRVDLLDRVEGVAQLARVDQHRERRVEVVPVADPRDESLRAVSARRAFAELVAGLNGELADFHDPFPRLLIRRS